MKVKVFDVVEVNNGTKATVLEIIQGGYNVEVVDKRGNSKGRKTISVYIKTKVWYNMKVINAMQ